MWRDLYVTQKIRELEREQQERRIAAEAVDAAARAPAPRARRLAPVARFAGRRVRALGEAIESWAGPERARA
jgi:hypothetical protein